MKPRQRGVCGSRRGLTERDWRALDCVNEVGCSDNVVGRALRDHARAALQDARVLSTDVTRGLEAEAVNQVSVGAIDIAWSVEVCTPQARVRSMKCRAQERVRRSAGPVLTRKDCPSVPLCGRDRFVVGRETRAQRSPTLPRLCTWRVIAQEPLHRSRQRHRLGLHVALQAGYAQSSAVHERESALSYGGARQSKRPS